MPGVSQILRQLVDREIGEKLRTSVGKGFPPEGRQNLFRLRGEIAARYRRTDLALAPEETTHVPSELSQQAMGVVLRMALEIDEETLSLLLDEAVDAGLCRL